MDHPPLQWKICGEKEARKIELRIVFLNDKIAPPAHGAKA